MLCCRILVQALELGLRTHSYWRTCSHIRRLAVRTCLYVYIVSTSITQPLIICQDVLRAYDAVRVPRASYIAIASERAGNVYRGNGPSGPSDEGRRRDLHMQWEDVWQHDARTDVSRAVEMLVRNGVFEQEFVAKL